MAYYLGIDGGGTKTACAVGDQKTILARSTAGPSNIVRVGEAEARQSLHQGVANSCAAAGISPRQLTRTCMGAAGATSPKIAEMLRATLAEIVSGEIVVTGDMRIALEAAVGGGAGAVVIAGTGSIAYARDAQGNTARAGGYGFAISDEGSAHWIGRRAIAAMLHDWDLLPENARQGTAGPDFLFFRAVQPVWKVDSLDDLVRVANATPAADFAALLPAVLACAEAGDAACRDVLAQAGRALAQLAAVVVERLFPASRKAQSGLSVPVAMVGGVFRHSAMVREVFYNEVKKLHPQVEVPAQVVEPVEGALRLARQS